MPTGTTHRRVRSLMPPRSTDAAAGNRPTDRPNREETVTPGPKRSQFLRTPRWRVAVLRFGQRPAQRRAKDIAPDGMLYVSCTVMYWCASRNFPPRAKERFRNQRIRRIYSSTSRKYSNEKMLISFTIHRRKYLRDSHGCFLNTGLEQKILSFSHFFNIYKIIKHFSNSIKSNFDNL